MLSYFTSPEEPRWTRWLLLLFIPLALLYYVAGKGNGETKNHDVTDKDQKVYLNTASRIAHDPIGYVTPRQRTPGYPYFLSMFYSKEKFDMPEGSKPPFSLDWFERGKQINLVLSMFMLGGDRDCRSSSRGSSRWRAVCCCSFTRPDTCSRN